MRAKIHNRWRSAPALVGAGHAPAAEPTAAGLWQAVDRETASPTAGFSFAITTARLRRNDRQDVHEAGRNTNVVCDQCNDDRHDKPWLGLEIIRGMKRDGLHIRRWDHSRSAPRPHLQRVDDSHAGRPVAHRARLSRHLAVWAKPILDAIAGFGLQRDRSRFNPNPPTPQPQPRASLKPRRSRRLPARH